MPTKDLLQNLKTKQRQRSVRERQRQETVYAVPCPECTGERWLKKRDALKALSENRLCHSCSQREKGKKGWQVTKARWGEKTVVKHQQAYRIANPSNLEREIMLILEDLALDYSREVWCEENGKVFLIDFVVEKLAIEVNGKFVHAKRQSEDALKEASLKYCGYQVIVLSERLIRAGEARKTILNALKELAQ